MKQTIVFPGIDKTFTIEQLWKWVNPTTFVEYYNKMRNNNHFFNILPTAQMQCCCCMISCMP